MAEVQLRAERGIYSFVWADLQVAVRLERLSESRGTITAELTAKSLLPGVPSHLHQAKLNLQSTRARKEVAQHLAERVDSVPWGDLLEQACTLTLQRYREGEPLVRLDDGEEIESPRYLLHPVLPLNQPTVVFGDGGCGKSTLGNLFSILIAIPWLDNPFDLDVLDEKINILVLDWETDPNAAKWNLKRLLRGLGKSNVMIFYKRCTLPLGDGLPEVQKDLMDIDATFVIIDSAAAAAGGDPNSPEVACQFFRDLRQLDVTSLILAHNSKNGTGDRSIYGSVFWTNYARSVWELKKHQEVGEDCLDVGLFCRKANLSKLFKPIGFKFQYENSRILVSRQKLQNVPELSAGLPLWMQITEVLKSDPADAVTLSEELQTSQNSVRGTLNRYKQRFIKVGDKWGLRSEQSSFK